MVIEGVGRFTMGMIFRELCDNDDFVFFVIIDFYLGFIIYKMNIR